MQKILTSPRLYMPVCSAARVHSATLDKVCSAQLASVFACSRRGIEGQLEWWSPLSGHAKAFAELTVVEQQQLLKTLVQRKEQLAKRAEKLATAGQTDAAQTLRTLLSDSEFGQLYSIDQQPILVDWCARRSDAVIAASMPPSAADTAALVMAANAATSLRAANTTKQTQHWLWLLFLLPLLALALFIFKF